MTNRTTKYLFPAEFLTCLTLRQETYTIPFITAEVLRKCTLVQGRTNRYNMPMELYNILRKDPYYHTRAPAIIVTKADINRYINSLKTEYIDNYVTITDVLSSNSVHQLIVVMS